jgi:hypothetical protein
MWDAEDKSLQIIHLRNSESSKGVNNIGIVSHGNMLSYFTAQYTDVTPYALHDKIHMPDVAVFDWETKQFVKLWEEINL